MNFVEPLRDKKKIAQIKNLLIGAELYRDLLLFTVGINTALHISDHLTLQLEQVVAADLELCGTFILHVEKRNKRNFVTINTSIEQALTAYLAAYPKILTNPDPYLLFSSRRPTPTFTKPLSREHAERLMSEMCQAVGLTGSSGTHTLQKT
jgi:site-specific recombinase XerD